MCLSREPTGNQSNAGHRGDDGFSCKREVGNMMEFAMNWKLELMIRTKIAFLNSCVGSHLC